MFYPLCVCLILAVMFVVFTLTTLATVPALKVLAGLTRRIRAGTVANLFFIFRSLPVIFGIIASIGLALPAFLRFEPHSTSEMPGAALLLLAASGLFIMLVMAGRCLQILRLTLSLQRRWMKNANPLTVNFRGIPVFCVKDSASLVVVAGIFVPRIFISQDVADVLNGAELDAALSHELAHIHTGDNLRQLVLKITRAPKFWGSVAGIDSLWAIASEIAADERAIAQGTSPLELSSALVKVGRLSFQHGSQLLAVSHLTDGCSSSTFMRAGRLRDLLERGVSAEQTSWHGHGTYHWLAWVVIILLVYSFALGTMLPSVHEALEFIVH